MTVYTRHMENRRWKLYNSPEQEDAIPYLFNWFLKGEVELCLSLTVGPVYSDDDGIVRVIYSGPNFSMARILRDLNSVRHFIPNFSFAEEELKKYGEYPNVFWHGISIAELEDYCKQSLLPLPEGYKEAWAHMYETWLDLRHTRL